MIRLCEEIASRGGSPEDPLVYKKKYHDRLLEHISKRVDGLERGDTTAEDHLVPGCL